MCYCVLSPFTSTIRSLPLLGSCVNHSCCPQNTHFSNIPFISLALMESFCFLYYLISPHLFSVALLKMWISRLRFCSQKSSLYLPVSRSPPPPSPSSSTRDNPKDAKEKKAREAELAGTKRRSTMNSREAAYDEEELVRRVIEESKEDNKSPSDDLASRRGKRTRSDSDMYVFPLNLYHSNIS